MRISFLLPIALVLLISLGCTEGGAQGGTKGNRVGDADGNLGPWFRSTHPCIGNRTDAMWFDDANTGFVGCGSTTEGYGLYGTSDGGATWSATPSTGDFVASMRVNSISRGSDGKLYVGGTGNSGARVITLDGGTLGEFYLKPASGAQSWQTYQVGTFRIDSKGRAISESLTGSDVMYWPNSGGQQVTADDAINGYGWWNDAEVEGNGAQILDMEIFDDRFYAVGSTISQPPYFFFEPQGGFADDAFNPTAIKLSGDGLSAFIGEVWDISIDSGGDMLLSGVNQSSNVGVVWFNSGDPTQASNWTMFDAGPVIPDTPNNSTRFYGGCREGDLMMAVGDYSQRSDALAIVSLDGGASWAMVNPPGRGADAVGPLSQCQIFGDQIYITGADGFFGILDTTGL